MSKVFTITEGLENLGALRTGGQGSVYKGKRMGAIISAVKLLPTPIHSESEDDKNFRNFTSEVAKLQKVNEEPNPNVVKILSSGITESGSLPYIEMEYIEGPDLCDLLQPPYKPIFELKEVIRVADQLAGALAHCHRVGVKHGDIKSNNVKYNRHTGNYVLLDFGLAIMTDEQRRSSIRNAGAVEFMAPEQHEGHMLPQTDVYSYGVVLFELLTGEVPFPLLSTGETARNAVMVAHMESPLPDVRIKRSNKLPAEWPAEKQQQEMQIPGWLLEVVSKCLQKKPEDRYTSAVELHDAILAGSLATADVKGQSGELGMIALQEEKERLEALIMQFQQMDVEKGKQIASLKPLALEAGAGFNESKGVYEWRKSLVHIPKNWFYTLVGLCGLFFLLFAYSFFSKPKVAAKDNMVKIDSAYRSPYVFARPLNVDSLMKAREQPVVEQGRTAAARVSTTNGKKRFVPPGQAKKKKRKRFLGIF